MTDKSPPTFCYKTKKRCYYWYEVLVMPVGIPSSDSYGKGWDDPCNCFCGTICFTPKAALLILTAPAFCCVEVDKE